MQITVKEVEKTLNNYSNIDEPIFVKRENKDDVVILSLKEYKEKMLEKEIIEHLKKSEKDIENGKTISADKFFNELRKKYGY